MKSLERPIIEKIYEFDLALHAAFGKWSSMIVGEDGVFVFRWVSIKLRLDEISKRKNSK